MNKVKQPNVVITMAINDGRGASFICTPVNIFPEDVALLAQLFGSLLEIRLGKNA